MKTVTGSSIKQTNKYKYLKLKQKNQIVKIKIPFKIGARAATSAWWTDGTVSMNHCCIYQCRLALHACAQLFIVGQVWYVFLCCLTNTIRQM